MTKPNQTSTDNAQDNVAAADNAQEKKTTPAPKLVRKVEYIAKAEPPFKTPDQVKLLEEISNLWFGTPFITNNQIVGKGVDCVRLPVCILVSCGALPQDFQWPQYGSTATKEVNWKAIKEGIDKHGFEEVKDVKKLQPGDLLVFALGKQETVHLGLHLSSGFVHVMPNHTARRDDMTEKWKGRLKSVWRPVKTWTEKVSQLPVKS